MSIRKAVQRCATFIVLALIVCNCSAPVDNHPQQAKTHKSAPATHVDVDEFITQLSIVQLMLIKNSPEQDIKPHIAIIKTYVSQKQKTSVSQPSIIVYYTSGDSKEIRQLLVPFVLSQETSDFPSLQKNLNVLEGAPYNVRDVHPVIITVDPIKHFKLSDGDPQKTQEFVEQELHRLLGKTDSLTPVEEARVQIHLLQFFMDHHIRDAAYLAAENAKQSLATAEDGNGNPDIIKTLTEKLEALESQLHKNMPFSIL